MSNEEFRDQIKAIVDEARTKGYCEFVLNSDLDRAIKYFESDIRDDERASVEEERADEERYWN